MTQARSKRNIANGSERPRNHRQPEFPTRKPKRERVPHAMDIEEEEDLSVRTHPAGGAGVEHWDEDEPAPARRPDQ